MILKTYFDKFINSYFYIIFLTLTTFICWYFNIYHISMIIFTLLIIYILLFLKDVSLIIPPAMLSPYLFSENAVDINVNLLVYIFAPVILFAFVFYIIKNKVTLKKGKYFLGFFLAMIAFSLGGFFFDNLISNHLITFGMSFFILFLYTFFYSAKTKNFKNIFLNSVKAIVILLLLQILCYYLRVSDITNAILLKKIHLGWGNSNNVGLVLSMLLPLTFYNSLKNRGYLLLACLQYIGILFSLSRGNILFGGIFFLIMLIFCIVTSKDKLFYIIMTIFSCLFIMILFLIFREYFNALYKELSAIFLDDNGRFKLFKESIVDFKLNPLFGIGYYYKYNIIPHWYHNTLLQILASTGIIGSILFIPFFYQRYIVVLKNLNISNFFMLCSILLSALYGLVDCNFFFIYNSIITVFIYLLIETEDKTVNTLKFLKLKNKTLRK